MGAPTPSDLSPEGPAGDGAARRPPRLRWGQSSGPLACAASSLTRLQRAAQRAAATWELGSGTQAPTRSRWAGASLNGLRGCWCHAWCWGQEAQTGRTAPPSGDRRDVARCVPGLRAGFPDRVTLLWCLT